MGKRFLSFVREMSRGVGATLGVLLGALPLMAMVVALSTSTFKLGATASNEPGSLNHFFYVGLIVAILGTVGGVLLAWINETRASIAKNKKIEVAERAATDNPAKPQLAWVAGQARLEKYLDRNLAQVRTIAILTYLVMLFGFSFIVYGLFQAFADPTKLPVSIVASASGVLISFIGGSFLLVYRSLLAQSREHLFVLERINGVGMSVAVMESIPDADRELRSKTTAELARTLLTLYGASK